MIDLYEKISITREEIEKELNQIIDDFKSDDNKKVEVKQVEKSIKLYTLLNKKAKIELSNLELKQLEKLEILTSFIIIKKEKKLIKNKITFSQFKKYQNPEIVNITNKNVNAWIIVINYIMNEVEKAKEQKKQKKKESIKKAEISIKKTSEKEDKKDQKPNYFEKIKTIKIYLKKEPMRAF